MFTAEAQRALRGAFFVCRETTTNKKVPRLNELKTDLGRSFCPIAVSRLGKTDILCALSVSSVRFLKSKLSPGSIFFVCAGLRPSAVCNLKAFLNRGLTPTNADTSSNMIPVAQAGRFMLVSLDSFRLARPSKFQTRVV